FSSAVPLPLCLVLVPPDPLAHRVVGYAVLPADRHEAHRLEVGEQLFVGRTVDLAGLRMRASPGLVVTHSAIPRAVAMLAAARNEELPAVRAPALRELVLPTTMRVQRRGTVRANDPQVLDAVVVWHAVDVVEDQGHARPVPVLVLTTELAATRLQTGLVQPA